jgi:hypothetical protein
MGLRNAEYYFSNPEVLLGFMRRTRKPVFHKSNIFFRDIQFAVRDYFDTVERSPISVPEAERLAIDVVQLYMEVGLLRQVNNQAYVLDSPEFSTPKTGTYAMLTIHGAPLPGEAEEALEVAIAGTPADATFQEKELKGGDVSPEGAAMAELTLAATSESDAKSETLESGAPEEPHVDPQEATTNKPNPKVERHFK